MRQTLESVIAQTVRPAKWVIVDDGSTDQTPEILREYTNKYDWIEVVTRENRGHRAVGPGVIDAFYAGYSTIDIQEYKYFCKLDLDLRLPEKYFEILLKRMEAVPRLGTCSGKSYQQNNGRLISERLSDETSLGMTKLFRISCFEEIGGFVRGVNWDGIDCHLCRMNGWIACSWDEPELRFIHLRPMSSSQVSIFHGRMRQGYGQYFTGTSFWYMVAVAINRSIEKPYVFGSLSMLLSYIISAIQRKPRYGDAQFRSFLRKYQWSALLRGKDYAIRKIYIENGIEWPINFTE
jgi:glycosyltransferase involved in cell wall biosynthesis